MSIWGKIAGAAAGLALGGPLGALVGALAGHYVVDDDVFELRGERGPDHPRNQIAFTIGVIALSAKMAKADGEVTLDEVEAFNRFFSVPPDEARNVARVFDLARQDVAGYEGYASQLSKLFGAGDPVLEDVLDGLFYIAMADAVMHPGEIEYLERVSEIFGFGPGDFARIKERHLGPDKADPYVVLNVSREASDDDIKSVYRQLVKENHPDQVMARGVPEEFVQLANERLAAINVAYEKIRRERGLK
ncbi:MAG: DnaJ family molecular chaperone [Alphaproteobacteria bacterium]|nr:MAG: DnaJ family molecular chaperone [Alphaproteobacteria bacterium]